MNFYHRVDSPEGPYVQVSSGSFCLEMINARYHMTSLTDHMTCSLQSMPSEVLCNQLTIMSQALQQAVHIISSSELASEAAATSKRAAQDYHAHSRGDHRRMLQRGQDIEARKEFIENERKAIVGGVMGGRGRCSCVISGFSKVMVFSLLNYL